MKKIMFFALFCAFFSVQGQIRVATYNLRNENPNDVGNMWEQRLPYVAALILFHDFDVFGTQEGLEKQLKELKSALKDYDYYGKGRKDGKSDGEHSAIFYKTDVFELLNAGDFWLSQTPEKPSLGWDATCCNRICSWVLLKEKSSGKKFYFLNAHLDHEGKTARRESANLILKKTKELLKNEVASVVVMGDFNDAVGSEAFRILQKSKFLHYAANDVPKPYLNNASYNGFGSNVLSDDVIDYIFISNDLRASKFGMLTDTYHGKYPSDHFPIMAVISEL